MLAATYYGAGVLSDEELDKIRGSGSYRAAVWLARFNFVLLALLFLLVIWLGPDSKTGPSPWYLDVLFVLLALSMVTIVVLIRRAGVRFEAPFMRVADHRMARYMYKDVFWFRRP